MTHSELKRARRPNHPLIVAETNQALITSIKQQFRNWNVIRHPKGYTHPRHLQAIKKPFYL